MKSRTKSTKACISIESKKSKQKLNESKITKSVSKKTEVELRANLENTLKLLQSRLKIKPENKSSTTTLNLSSAIYKIVQEHIPEKVKVSAGPTLHSFENSGSDFMKEREASKEQPKKLQQNPSSSLMDYFKDKFGSPATDEQTVERKLKALQVLKRSQELVSRCSSHYNSSLHSGLDLDIGGKEMVIGKLKQKRKNC